MPRVAAEFNRQQRERYRTDSVFRAARLAQIRKQRSQDHVKERARWRHIKQRYGLTREEFEAIFEAQGRCCGACKTTTPSPNKGWVVDHCHKTNQVRGILCQRCNIALGFYDATKDLFGLFEAYLMDSKRLIDTINH